jgi:hypothetical protein
MHPFVHLQGVFIIAFLGGDNVGGCHFNLLPLNGGE